MISLIVPFFNSEKYIAQCLESIINQEVDDLEIICVNDGSQDNSRSLVEKFKEKDNRIKIIDQVNKGRSSARNLGLDNARGEFICFVDSDDKIYEGSIRKLYDHLTEDVDAVVSSIDVCYEVHSDKSLQDKAYYSIKFSGDQLVTPHLLSSFHCSVCGCLFRKSIIENKNIRFPVDLNYEDAYFHWAYFSSAKKINFFREPTYLYIRRQGSIMSKTFNKAKESIEHLFIVEKILVFLKHEGKLQGYHDEIIKLLVNYFHLAFEFSPEEDKCRTVVECQRIISSFNLDVSKSKVLTDIKKGQIGYLFENDDESFRLAIKLIEILNILFPKNTYRRSCILRLGRLLYKSQC